MIRKINPESKYNLGKNSLSLRLNLAYIQFNLVLILISEPFYLVVF